MMKKDDYLIRRLEDSGNEQNSFSLIADIDSTVDSEVDLKINSGDVVPVLPLRNMILFPDVYMPVAIGRKSSLKLVKECERKEKNIAVFCQKDAQTESPEFDDLYHIGTVASIVRILDMPDNTTTVILRGIKRCELQSVDQFEPYLKGVVNLFEDAMP